jgi:hypothetical protein
MQIGMTKLCKDDTVMQIGEFSSVRLTVFVTKIRAEVWF